MAGSEEETGKIIRMMAADMEARRTIREYKDNGTLLGKVRVMAANRTRFETAGFYTQLLHESMKSVRAAGKKLKEALSKSGAKSGSQFSKRMDAIMTKFEDQQDRFDETLSELDMVTVYLNNDSDGEDGNDDDFSGPKPLPVRGNESRSSLNLCSVPTHGLDDEDEYGSEKKTACYDV